jgi:hypothetical protein
MSVWLLLVFVMSTSNHLKPIVVCLSFENLKCTTYMKREKKQKEKKKKDGPSLVGDPKRLPRLDCPNHCQNLRY